MTGLPQPVRCRETGVVYPSLSRAARALRVRPIDISQAIRGLRQDAPAGRTWEYFGPPGKPPRARPVALGDGRVFPSVSAVVRELGGTTGNLIRCLKNGWGYRGHRVRYADRPAPPGWGGVSDG